MNGQGLGAGEVTRILAAASAGDSSGLERLFPLVYEELHEIARRQFLRERRGHTLQPTAIVHEAYLRVAQDATRGWKDRAHFVALAARVMRQVLVDHHRRRSALKRAGGAARITLHPNAGAFEESTLDVLALEEALDKLSALDARKARVVELRVFGGLGVEETAHVLEVSARTVEADWCMARAWLRRELAAEGPSPS